MEKKEATQIEVLNLDQFKKDYFDMLSPYFKNIFSNYFRNIKFVKVNNQNAIFYFDLVIDERCANPLNIVHGGALATLIENLSTVSLFYLCKIVYKTIDISINYKNQVPLNKPIIIVVNCQKAGANTSFVEVEIMGNEGEVSTHSSLIKNKKEKTKSKIQKNDLQINTSSIVPKF